MKAIVFTKYGSPEGLEFKDVPTPCPKHGEVLVRVHASSVNSWDWEFLNGVPLINRLALGFFKPKPGKQRLGADIAGTIDAVGSDVTKFQTGDQVFGDLWSNWGGFAEYAVAHENSLERKPTNLTFEQAAVVPQAGVLALQGLRKAKQLPLGKNVLINGAGGGVGTFAIQLAKLAGAKVTGVDAAHKLDIMRSVGADHVIDFQQEDFTKTGKRYDLIIDCQNFRPLAATKRALAPGGTFAMVGGSRILPILLQGLWSRLLGDSRSFHIVADGPNKGLAYLKELIEDEKLVPVIDKTFKFTDVPQALHYFGTGQHKGKIAITMEV